jgi:hypothetical protein
VHQDICPTTAPLILAARCLSLLLLLLLLLLQA